MIQFCNRGVLVIYEALLMIFMDLSRTKEISATWPLVSEARVWYNVNEGDLERTWRIYDQWTGGLGSVVSSTSSLVLCEVHIL